MSGRVKQSGGFPPWLSLWLAFLFPPTTPPIYQSRPLRQHPARDFLKIFRVRKLCRGLELGRGSYLRKVFGGKGLRQRGAGPLHFGVSGLVVLIRLTSL